MADTAPRMTASRGDDYEQVYDHFSIHRRYGRIQCRDGTRGGNASDAGD
jgi:hypothetical protein